MKTLTLLRHAKSAWDDPIARDFDRPLNKRGRRAARKIGREMRAQRLAFDQVIASPAVRVIETLVDVVDGYGGPLDPDYDKRVYLASAQTLLDVVHEAKAKADRLLIVGHNPGLEHLALLITAGGGEGGDLRSEVAVKYPTASLIEIRLPVKRWSEVGEGVGTITRFVRPRDLDPQLGPDEDTH